MPVIETDYLVVGAGAMGMAFTDTLVSETDVQVVVVDRGDQPGGHWANAYPFVRLHQPSAFYGVNSRKLGNDTIDASGWNEGLFELASGAEICAYFDEVMRHQLLPTGRVRYFPMSKYLGHGRFRTLAGQAYTVSVHRRVVDATYLRAVVPSMRPPPYPVAAQIKCVAPNELPKLWGHERYVIVGAGKTGMDACLWLLRHGVAPERLTWIMPRDPWLLDRVTLQPGPRFADRFRANFIAMLTASAEATSVPDLFSRLEAAGSLLRLDPDVRPAMYRCATVSRAELDQLRRITDIVRLGRVERIEADRIVLRDGSIPTSLSTLHIDCTADGLARQPATSVFDGGRLVLQSVRGCQQVFSAALIAHVEAAYGDDSAKNALCTPIPHPNSDLDWLRVSSTDFSNQIRWLEDPELMDWLASARLNLLAGLFAPLAARPRARERVLNIVKSMLSAAESRLRRLLAAHEATAAADNGADTSAEIYRQSNS